MKRIIDDVFAASYGSEELAQGNDAAGAARSHAGASALPFPPTPSS